jgi:hypothetical protein
MPIHDWTRVDAGIFHDFHQSWITEIKRVLNQGILPPDYYALAEQQAAGFAPDVVTLQLHGNGSVNQTPATLPGPAKGGARVAPPKLQPVAQTDMTFYRRKQNAISVRHVSGDELVAMVEIVSPGNEAGRNALRAFVQKTAALLNLGIHLLIIDVHPPGKRDPQGIHGEIWEEIACEEYVAPEDKPLTLAAYESDVTVRAYVVSLAVGDPLIDMPLFLETGKAVEVPLEATYQAAFAEVPRRWQRVVEAAC